MCGFRGWCPGWESAIYAARGYDLRRLRTAPCAATCSGAGRDPHRGALGIEHRHRKVKLRTLPNFALHPDPAAMHFHQMFGDGQAQPGSSGLAGPRGVHAVEALENTRLVRFGNTNAGVGDSEDDIRLANFRAEGDSPSR